MKKRRAGWLIAAVVAIGAVAPFTGLSTTTPAVAEPTKPRLVISGDTPVAKVIRRKPTRPVFFSNTLWVTSYDADFEVRVRRPDFQTPVSVEQWLDADGTTRVPLEADMADGWSGFADFFHMTVLSPTGKVKHESDASFCPVGRGASYHANVEGAPTARFPWYGCKGTFHVMPGGSDFTMGSVWAIDAGWKSRASTGGEFTGKDGVYTVEYAIADRYVDTFDIAPEAATFVQTVKVRTKRSASPQAQLGVRRSDVLPVPPGEGRTLGSPTMLVPDPATLPDIRPIPAYDLVTRTEDGKDLLRFTAMIYNAGPSPFVVDGTQESVGEDIPATQHFFDGDTEVGSAPIGSLKYEEHASHAHFHFEDFARYAILNDDLEEVIPSGKVGFCLAPTNPIDLAAPGAEWFPDVVGFGSLCGDNDPGAWYIREVLPAGWGDEYTQVVDGQAFDITNIPNGHYVLQVEVNPEGVIYEGSTENNVELRGVTLGGTPGARTAVIDPYPIA